ncbi:TIGR00730 family Rossman fold protein [Azospirillum sp. RWY-5-1]|uniref:Cytokinin riboside 5'-monophosphate phosphoribohydrolase n=1 Tax=Azospirillum oleiclasticum TaxID=2735135 RepID=A0ABX2T704_9PROT|nr:TIGR00730 family Rossman fold protein [Azospirillum oleiclasticum]NYZ11897.1 TIGR00730 family Rossman fold protein [Azospirillum oleiclasticum]NYZ19057.1 TIGR00730 family Rossman fold protein [Azospirillum oleiclasticum]
MILPNSVCVYCGASSRVSDRYKKAAHDLGTGLASRGVQLVYGGGRVGLMGIVADAAIAAGGRVVGIIPEHIQVLEVEHTALAELHVVDSMHTRKRMMVDRSDAFVVLPGGLGTLDETFEVLTWKQLRLHDKPIVIVDEGGYWAPLAGLVDHMIGEGFCQPGHRNLFRIVDRVEDVFDALAAEPEPSLPPASKWL